MKELNRLARTLNLKLKISIAWDVLEITMMIGLIYLVVKLFGSLEEFVTKF